MKRRSSDEVEAGNTAELDIPDAVTGFDTGFSKIGECDTRRAIAEWAGLFESRADLGSVGNRKAARQCDGGASDQRLKAR